MPKELTKGIPKTQQGVVTVTASRSGTAALRDLLEYIKLNGNMGHSFSIIVDPEASNDEGRKVFDWDGDGSDAINEVKAVIPEKEERKPLFKAYVIPPAFRMGKVSGQVPSKKRMKTLGQVQALSRMGARSGEGAANLVLGKLAGRPERMAVQGKDPFAMPGDLTEERLLAQDYPMFSPSSVVDNMSLDVTEAVAWTKFLETTMATSKNEAVFRKAVMEKLLESGWEGQVRKAVFTRALSHWRTVQKVSELEKAAQQYTIMSSEAQYVTRKEHEAVVIKDILKRQGPAFMSYVKKAMAAVGANDYKTEAGAWAQAEQAARNVRAGLAELGKFDQATKWDRYAIVAKSRKESAVVQTSIGESEQFVIKALYIGPRGGKWVDAKHTTPWKPPAGKKIHVVDLTGESSLEAQAIPERVRPPKAERDQMLKEIKAKLDALTAPVEARMAASEDVGRHPSVLDWMTEEELGQMHDLQLQAVGLEDTPEEARIRAAKSRAARRAARRAAKFTIKREPVTMAQMGVWEEGLAPEPEVTIPKKIKPKWAQHAKQKQAQLPEDPGYVVQAMRAGAIIRRRAEAGQHASLLMKVAPNQWARFYVSGRRELGDKIYTDEWAASQVATADNISIVPAPAKVPVTVKPAEKPVQTFTIPEKPEQATRKPKQPVQAEIFRSEERVVATTAQILTPEELLQKAEARGGTYYKRTPAKKAGKWRYFYNPEDYDKRDDAHRGGEETSKAYLSRKILGCVGEKGCDAKAMAPLVKKFGAKKVAEVLRENQNGGTLAFKKGKFSLCKRKG